MTASVRFPIEAFEKCDRCGVPAKVGASFLSGDLHFCGHHARALHPAILSKAITIYDPDGYLEFESTYLGKSE